MNLLTEDADLRCAHELGAVAIVAGQGWVRIGGRRVLIDDDPQARPITGCPNAGPTIKPCTATLAVDSGYSELIRINGRRVCLDTLTGLTDGTPPGSVEYRVRASGQAIVAEGAS
jgi:hypothetical protein